MARYLDPKNDLTFKRMNNRKSAVLWLRFLKEVGEDMRSLPPEMQEDEDIRQAAEICEIGAFTPEDLAAYEKYWDIISTEKTLYISALRKGETIGIAKGEEERTKLIAELDARNAELNITQKLAEHQAKQIADLQLQLNKKN